MTGSSVPAYTKTGTIEIVQDGRRETQYTTANTVPGQPGREVHTASFITKKSFGVDAPMEMFVLLTSRPTIEPDRGGPALRIEFSLDPETLAAKPGSGVAVKYDPGKQSRQTDAGLSDPVLTISDIRRLDEATLTMVGQVKGDWAGRPFSADFNIEQLSDRQAQ